MDFEKMHPSEESLDPQNWPEMRQLGHQMMDDMFNFLENIRDEPVWRPIPEATKMAFDQPLPTQPQPVGDVYADFTKHVFPYPKGNVHPRFWAWVQGNGTPFGALADFLASTLNPNVAIGEHAAMYVDRQVIDWCKTMFGWPKTGSGLLVSGGSIANITAIQVARNAFLDGQIRQKGLRQTGGQLLLYCSTETHSCLQKAVEVAGLGSESMRKVPVDAHFRIKTDELQAMISADRAAGHLPFCLVGNAGTVNTGAIDPLDELLAISRRENLWFHIDGAFGSLAKLLPEFSQKLAAIEQADSLAFDLHKWMYLNYEVGCVLIKNAAVHRASFALQPAYLMSHERGLAAGPDPTTNWGLELSRGFKALKIWMSMKEHGLEKFARLIRQNIAQVHFLAELIENEADLELLGPVELNVCCFRYLPPSENWTTERLNSLNKEILMRLQEEGIASPSFTFLEGKYAIRVANVNHRSRREDFEILVRETRRLGRELAKYDGIHAVAAR